MENKRDFFISTNLDDKNLSAIREDFELNTVDIREQDRKDWMHKITHALALVIIITFVLDVALQSIFRPDNIIIPDYFISIVSVVIGFYFARAFPFR